MLNMRHWLCTAATVGNATAAISYVFWPGMVAVVNQLHNLLTRPFAIKRQCFLFAVLLDCDLNLHVV